MNTDVFSKTLKTLLVASLGMLLMSGCNARKANVVKTYEPAELYLSAEGINTSVEKEELKLYDLTINIDNVNNASAYVVVENRGEKALSILSIKFHNNPENLFNLESSCGTQVMPGSECRLTVNFTGQYAGEFESDITISSNSNGRYVGVVGKVHVIANTMDRLKGFVRPLTNKNAKPKQKPMTKLDFSKNSLVKYAEFKNNGIDDITINGFSLVGEDSKHYSYTHECPTVLKVDQSCELQVTYKTKMEKPALSYLVIDSDGVLFPSDTIRLKGAPEVTKNAPKILQLAGNDAMNIKVVSVKTNKNNEKFLEDFSTIKPVYYFRTMYQKNTDVIFKEHYEELIAFYFEDNGFIVTSDASKADKILNIYPTITILQNDKGDIQVKSNVRASVITKTNGETPKEDPEAKGADEQIDFDMTIVANNYSDSYLAYVSASDMINSFMFNLLGLQD